MPTFNEPVLHKKNKKTVSMAAEMPPRRKWQGSNEKRYNAISNTMHSAPAEWAGLCLETGSSFPSIVRCYRVASVIQLETTSYLTHTHTHTHTQMAQKEASSQWQKRTKGPERDPSGRAPARRGYLTWRYASHYVTASQRPLLVPMNYWSTARFGPAVQLTALNRSGQRWQLLYDCQWRLDQSLGDFKRRGQQRAFAWWELMHAWCITVPLTLISPDWSD